MNVSAEHLDGNAQRVPPYAIEAEAAILGGLLLDNAAWDVMGDMLAAGDFYRHEHRIVFEVLSSIISAGKPADVVTVWQRIKALGKADQVDMPALNDLAQYVPSAGNMRRHAEIVRECSLSRRLVQAGDEIASLGFDTAMGFDHRLESATSMLMALERTAPKDEWVSAMAGMVSHLEVLESRAEGRVTAWATGLDELDDVLEGGVHPGALVIVAARPSMGKTALALTVGLHMAQTYVVGMLSMEMPHSELNDRMTAMLGRVSMSAVKRPALGAGLQWDRVVDGTTKAQELRWFASDQGNLTINQVRTKARNLKRLHGLNVLIVDYIGLMAGVDPKQNRAYQLEEISRGLKTLAKELDICVLCLAQVNRKVEERAEHAPVLSDLRDSGAIEQDADVVMFIHRPIQQKPELSDEWKHYAKLTVAKNRQGRCGVMHLSYLGDQTRFGNWVGLPPTNKAVTPARGMPV